ncbi:MAG: FHA domain-containing protein [Planctomycetota bacterium]|nr:FHA domain-containing protein [Planctomycetota bacterium]
MSNIHSRIAVDSRWGTHQVIQESTMKPVTDTNRFILWVDAVGGYLVCLNDVITLGQAIQGTSVDIPLVADVSRKHATIRRINDQYILEPISPVWIQGVEITKATPLSHGDHIQLGSVQLLYSKPHPLSVTARLDFTNRHGTNPRTDGILLMGDSLIVGNHQHDHVVYPYDDHQIVLYRCPEGLSCRSNQPLQIDEQEETNEGAIYLGSRIKSELISLGLEEL